MERKLKRSLSSELTGRECWWGRVCELRAFEVLPNNYLLSSEITEFHPTQKPVALIEYLIRTYTNE